MLKGIATRLPPKARIEQGALVGDSEPYSVSDLNDYTIPVGGEGEVDCFTLRSRNAKI